MTKDEVVLQDLVKNIKLPAEYAQIPMGFAPFKKNNRIIDANFIKETLIRQQKTDYLPKENVSVTISNKTATLAALDQKKMLTEAIDSLLKNDNYKLELRSVLKDITYPVRDKIEIELLDKNRVRLSGNQLFQIQIKLNGRIFDKININTFIRIFRTVLVTNNKLAKNDLINTADLTSSEKEVTGFENEIVSSLADLADSRAAQLIPEGSIMRKSLLSPIPVIKRGEIIKLIAKEDAVEIILAATALSDSQNGQVSKFKINTTAAVVPALVTGPGQAELRR